MSSCMMSSSSELGSVEEDAQDTAPLLGTTQPEHQTVSKKSLCSTSSGTDMKATEPVSGICRICLEEDSLDHLEEPCGCTGTQRHAHHECIQRWVDEKGHTRCEICNEQYQGDYEAPPPPAPDMADHVSLFAPMYILDPTDPRARGNLVMMPLDEEDDGQQQSRFTWFFSFLIMFLFLVVLHHTLLVAEGLDIDMDEDQGTGTSGNPPPSDSGTTIEPDDYAASLSFFLLWVATKVILIGLPLYMVMRVAGRQARREQMEALMQEPMQTLHLYRRRRERRQSRQQRRAQAQEAVAAGATASQGATGVNGQPAASAPTGEEAV